MNKISKRTKIITTIGPASEKKATIAKLFDAGMTTIRLNFSHGNYKEHGARIKFAREVSSEKGSPISIMLDTKGPEIRIGKFKGGSIEITKGSKVKILTDSKSYSSKECVKNEMTVSYDMSQDLEAGKLVLVDDGKLQLTVTKVSPGVVLTEALNDHKVKTNKRVNLPGTKFSMPFLSEKDVKDIEYGCDQKVDFIAASFVNTPEDIKQIKDILARKNATGIKIYSKIESQYAVDNFDAILAETDGVMVARGDLGLEIPYYEVPVSQKMMIRKCREAGKPVIVATQMLDSMETNPHPTRAEVTDVYLATELGADATMLSGESAAGEFPIKTVETMATINRRAETEFYKKLFYAKQLETISKISSGPRSKKALKIAKLTQDGGYPFVITLTRTGELMREVSKFRPNTNIIGVTKEQDIITKFGITSSVYMSQDLEAFDQIKSNPDYAKQLAKHYGAETGNNIIVVDGKKITKLVV